MRLLAMTINSILGEEKKVLKQLEQQLLHFHFLIDDCKEFQSALAEVCINAIEHGNLEDPSKKVVVQVFLLGNRIRAKITDQGKGLVQEKGARSSRGWGLTIVQEFVDDWTMYQEVNAQQMFCFQIEKELRGRCDE